MRGVAAGQLVAFTLGAIFLAWILASGRSRLKLNFRAFTFQRAMFLDILKVGAISCVSPLQTVLTILIFTKILAGFGTATLAGYGMGSRLEFLLVPISFAFGVASVPMVGMAVGAGLVARARKVAWTAGAASGLTVGLIGLIVAVKPVLWVSLFTSDPGVTAAAYSYFAWAGPAFGFFGMAPASISPRRARRRSAARCWREPAGCCWSGSAAGGWCRSVRRPGPCSRWSAPPWCCSASAVAASVRLTRWQNDRSRTALHKSDLLLCRRLIFRGTIYGLQDRASSLRYWRRCSALPGTRARAASQPASG